MIVTDEMIIQTAGSDKDFRERMAKGAMIAEIHGAYSTIRKNNSNKIISKEKTYINYLDSTVKLVLSSAQGEMADALVQSINFQKKGDLLQSGGATFENGVNSIKSS